MYPETASLSVVLLTGKMEGTQTKEKKNSVFQMGEISIQMDI